jgi:uncharacterized protein
MNTVHALEFHRSVPGVGAVNQCVDGQAQRLALTDLEVARLETPPAGGYGNLPIELIRTERSCYAFDARNVCFIEVAPVAFDLLSVLRERAVTVDELVELLPHHAPSDVRRAYRDLRKAQADGLLRPYHFERSPAYQNDEYERILSARMGGFTFFVTTQCNLGCSYCIYGGQYEQHEELSQTAMPWETLKASLDFLARHSSESKEVRLDFFGGEPLLAFPTIQRGVRYLKSILPVEGPRVLVTITSNGTVITDPILDFLIEHDVYLQFSVDGGRASHDKFRTFKGSSRGSYDTILTSLKRIHDRDPVYYRRRMRMKGVLNTETVDIDDDEFFEHRLIRILVEERHFIFVNLEPHYDLAKDGDFFDRVDRLGRRLLEVRNAKTEEELLAGLNRKQRALYYHTLGLFFDAQAIQQVHFAGSDSVPFTKSCLTGYQQGAVTFNGDIAICLKSAKGDNFVIGNVLGGEWYFDKIKQLNTLFHEDWAGCSSCFVQKFCDLCYEKLNGEAGAWVSGRTRFCEFNRERYRTVFQYMLRVLENNPSLWTHLDTVIEAKFKEQAENSDEEPARFASRSLFSNEE